MLSQYSESHTEALLAALAIFATAAGQSWVKNHLGADFDVTNPFSDCVHDTSAVRSADMGQLDGDARYPLQFRQRWPI